MAAKKIFQIGSQEVRVRATPGLRGAHVRWLAPGTRLEVKADSRTEIGNYVWWQHDEGWSAERSLNGQFVYMLEVEPLPKTESAPASTPEPEAEPAKPTPKKFRVGGSQVRVRSTPSLGGAHIRWLDPGTEIEVIPDSRKEVGNYVWWQHDEGWSAERSLNDKEVYLIEVVEEAEPPTETPVPTKPASPAEISAAKKPFQVGNQEVRVRATPSLTGQMVRYLKIGEVVEVEADSRTEVGGYIWWKHADGWSAERSVDGTTIFLFEPGKVPAAKTPISAGSGVPDDDSLPLLNSLFQRLPVDLNQTRWWQYFGNNVYAYNLWRDGKYWYKYAQGLHGGLDFGNSSEAGIPVHAGVEGRFIKRDTQYTQPNGMWVKVDDYTVIYGHLVNPPALNPGDPVNVDTVMGELQFGGQNHLHLEVRYLDRWIVNPLLLMPEAMRSQITGKFPPNSSYFYQDAGWNQWQTPLDQPVLVLGGSLIGPHAPR